jgi:hypothetical protein
MLVYIYSVLTITVGISAMWKGAVYPGIAGIIGATLCWFAASGLKGSLMVGTPAQKRHGVLAATVFVAVGIGLVYHSGFWIGLFGVELSGVTWCVIGFAAGYVSTTRKHAES